MKKVLSIQRIIRAVGLFALMVLANNLLYAQAGQWTWMKGDSTVGSPGIFGTMGTPDSLNKPPGMYESADFQDSLGNFWIFGGLSSLGEYNTLWKYDLSLNEWTWVGGSNFPIQPGSYGTLGIPSPTNHPGARAWGVTTWSDEHGNFWLFGGYGHDANGQTGVLNDLWNFNVSTGEWMWVSGSSSIGDSGVYGIQTVPDSSNVPGGRCETATSWLDASNNLWLFGGENLIGDLNDLWRFDRSTNEWTWMKGSSLLNQAGTYGVLGTPNINNTPGARCAYTKWKDAAGDFWFFAGWTVTLGAATYNDVWRYTVSTNEWTWMSGSNVPYNTGSITSNCDPQISNVPSYRFEGRAAWNDCAGHFWTFGGDGLGQLSDLWSFNSTTLEWTRVSGSSLMGLPGFYGTQGVPSANTYPASRFGSPAWKDDSCNLWLFGGYATAGQLNDLWKFIADPSCPGNFSCMTACDQQQPVAFSSALQFLCEKFCTNFSDSSSNNPFGWQWFFPGGDPSSSTNQNPTNICYDVPGIYDVTLITTSASGNDTLTLYNYITVYPTPPFPTITQAGYTLTSSPAVSYQWQLNTVDIPGATNQSYTILQTGLYTVIVSDSNGCVNSTNKYVLIDAINELLSDATVSIYPNPATDNLIVEFFNEFSDDEISISLLNALGQEIFSSQQTVSSSNSKIEIDLRSVASGVYFIEIKSKDVFIKKKIVITH